MNESSSPIGFVAPEPSDLAPLFPGYEILDLIATGGMGAVYRAVQRSLDRTVALKILPLEFSEDAEFCAGFEAEAKAMARLNHPNLIGVYDFGDVNGMLFIVMEFVPGKSLHHSANGQAIDPRDVIRLVTGICNGLAHAHENGILHRDIKPSNILLTPQAEPKIGDFGLARPVERVTQAGEVIFGTPGYTAPEVVDAPETVDRRADLFSVGVLLHELLTGNLPADDPRPASLISGCDPRFDVIIRRATNPHPANRHPDAAEIATELQQITAAVAAGSLAKVPGGPRAGASGPSQHRLAKSAAVNRKSLKLTWIGPLLAISIMAFCWYKFINTKPRIVVVGGPAARSSSTGGPGSDSDKEEKQEKSQALPEATPSQQSPPPSVSNTRDMAPPPISPPTEVKKQVTTVFEATDLTSLRDKRKQHATVKGKVLKTGVNKPGTIRFLNFTEPYGNSLSVMMLVSDAPNEFTDQQLQFYVGKSIQFSGIVEEHQGALQIQVPSLEELRIVEREPLRPISSSATGLAGEKRQTPPGVPKEAVYFNGKWYLVYGDPCSWQNGREKCEALGGQLMVVADVATNDFAKSLAAGRQLWLGATDEKNEGRWLWVDGSEMKFRRFDQGQPDNKNRAEKPENYLLIRANGFWNDANQQSETFGYICEWPDKPAVSAVTAGASSESSDLASWKKRALQEFPALKDPESELTRSVKALREKKESLTPSYFNNSQWPYLLAKEASMVGEETRNRAAERTRIRLDQKLLINARSQLLLPGAEGGLPMDLKVSIVSKDRAFPVYEELWNESDVFVIHPLDRQTPGTVDFSGVTGKSTGTLILKARDHPNGDCRYEILKSGKMFKADELKTDRWKTIEIPFHNEPVVVAILPTEWFFEYAFITYSVR